MTVIDAVAPSRFGSRAEIELLVTCSNPRCGADKWPWSEAALSSIDWTLLIGQAIRHGVSPLVAESLLTSVPDLLPEGLREGLREHIADNALRNKVLLAALDEALQALEKQGVTALAFKGQTLAERVFDDYALRRAGDLDVLVRKQDLAVVWRVLERLGYREDTEHDTGRPMSDREHRAYLQYQCEYAFNRDLDHVMIEPHWAIVPEPHKVRLPYGEFWDAAETLSIAGRRILTLSPEHLLLVVCVHACKHEWSRLQWISDVTGLLTCRARPDVERVLAVAREHGVERMVLTGLGLARRIHGCELSDRGQSRLRTDAGALRLIDEITGALFQPDREESSVWEVTSLRFRMRERWIDRMRYAVAMLTTPIQRHYQMVDLPAPLRGLYVPIKMGHDYVALPAWRMLKRSRPARAPARADDNRE